MVARLTYPIISCHKQIWGMVSHRFTTFQHILSTTTLPCEKDEYDDKRLQESTRETIFETLMYKKGSVWVSASNQDRFSIKIIFSGVGWCLAKSQIQHKLKHGSILSGIPFTNMD